MPKPERTAAILVAAGRGLRAGAGGRFRQLHRASLSTGDRFAPLGLVVSGTYEWRPRDPLYLEHDGAVMLHRYRHRVSQITAAAEPAAFGVPDPEISGSERVMVSIRLKDEYQGKVDAAEIRELCRKFLAPYEVPTFIEFREDMPLTVSEKVFKKALRDEAIEKMKAGREGL